MASIWENFLLQNVSPLHLKKELKITSLNSGPSSLTTEPITAAYRRASEGGANIHIKEPKNKLSVTDKKNEV